MRTHNRITSYEREQILKGLHIGKSYRTIASELSRSPSSICREVNRNLYRYKIPEYGYSVFAAQYFTECRASGRRAGKGKMQKAPKLFNLVVDKLKKRWSPEQISRYLSITYSDDPTMQLSHESIYTYIYVLSIVQDAGYGEHRRAT